MLLYRMSKDVSNNIIDWDIFKSSKGLDPPPLRGADRSTSTRCYHQAKKRISIIKSWRLEWHSTNAIKQSFYITRCGLTLWERYNTALVR